MGDGVRAYRFAVEVVVEPDHPAYDAVGAVPDRTDAYSERDGIVQHVLITGEERTAAEDVYWPSEEFAQLSTEAGQPEQGRVLGEIHEEVDIGAGVSVAAGDGAEDADVRHAVPIRELFDLRRARSHE